MKTICIYHSRDLDGWMSAAIVRHWWKLNNIQSFTKGGVLKVTHPKPKSLEFLGWDYDQEIPDLSDYDEVIMCDVSFSPKEMIILYNKLLDNFIWNDHHKSAITDSIDNKYVYTRGLRNDKFAACELTWKYFFPNEEMPEIVRLLGRYDCFGHKGTDEEQKVLEFQYGARQVISNYEEAYNFLIYGDDLANLEILNTGKSIYQYLCTEAKQIYNKSFEIELLEPSIINTTLGKMEQGSYKKKFLCVNQDRFNPVNFGIDYHKEDYDGFTCFWYKEGRWHFSLYNDNGNVDCSVISRRFGGGGHKGAAGFVCDTETMLNIIGNGLDKHKR